MISEIITVTILASSVIQAVYYVYFSYSFRYFYHKDSSTAAHRAQLPDHPADMVSVIICAYNEADNLSQNLESVLTQQYHNAQRAPCYEVVVVNDRSTDNTSEILLALKGKYDHLTVVTIDAAEQRQFPGKKYALSKGIAAAKYEFLLMTDADCQPATRSWISWMVYPLSKGKSIVSGYGAYNTAPGMLNRFIRTETLHTFMQLAAYARAGLPYMAVGRNLACRKELLLVAQSNEVWNMTPSGDDDLLVCLCGTKENMTVNIHHGSFTWSKPKMSWKEWLVQKQRHVSTGKYYKPFTKSLLGFYALNHALFYLLVLVLAFSTWSVLTLNLVVIAVFIRFVGFTYTLLSCSQYLVDRKEQRLKFFFPIFDIGWTIYNFVLSPYIFWKNKQQWK